MVLWEELDRECMVQEGWALGQEGWARVQEGTGCRRHRCEVVGIPRMRAVRAVAEVEGAVEGLVVHMAELGKGVDVAIPMLRMVRPAGIRSDVKGWSKDTLYYDS